MNFFKQQLSKLYSASALDLKSYITHSSVKNIYSHTNYSKLSISVDYDRPKFHRDDVIIYGYATRVMSYGDFIILNERTHFTTSAEALGDITRQVFEISDIVSHGFIVAAISSHLKDVSNDYYNWDFDKKTWSQITSDIYYDILSS